MFDMNAWDWALLVAAAYFAIMALVRLMRNRRDIIVEELSLRAEMESRRLALEKKAEERRKARERLHHHAA